MTTFQFIIGATLVILVVMVGYLIASVEYLKDRLGLIRGRQKTDELTLDTVARKVDRLLEETQIIKGLPISRVEAEQIVRLAEKAAAKSEPWPYVKQSDPNSTSH